jgi:hypothetical protein
MIYARLSYNSNNWIRPSGPNGKSKSLTTFEAKYGFGFEEWLFDRESKTSGYSYGYVEGIKQNYRTGDNQHVLRLYTLYYPIRYAKAQRLFVAEIQKWEKVNWEENQHIVGVWSQTGRIKRMRQQLIDVGADLNPFNESVNNQNGNQRQLVNIKYKGVPIIKIIDIDNDHTVKTFNYFKIKR